MSPDYNVLREITYRDGVPVDTSYNSSNWNYYHGPDLIMLDDWDKRNSIDFGPPTEEEQAFWEDLTSHFDSLGERYKNLSWAQKLLYNIRQKLGIWGSQKVEAPIKTNRAYRK